MLQIDGFVSAAGSPQLEASQKLRSPLLLAVLTSPQSIKKTETRSSASVLIHTYKDDSPLDLKGSFT